MMIESASSMVSWVSSVMVPVGPFRQPRQGWKSRRAPYLARMSKGRMPSAGRPSASPIAPASSVPRYLAG